MSRPGSERWPKPSEVGYVMDYPVDLTLINQRLKDSIQRDDLDGAFQAIRDGANYIMDGIVGLTYDNFSNVNRKKYWDVVHNLTRRFIGYLPVSLIFTQDEVVDAVNKLLTNTDPEQLYAYLTAAWLKDDLSAINVYRQVFEQVVNSPMRLEGSQRSDQLPKSKC
jgi:hypothetical protein